MVFGRAETFIEQGQVARRQLEEADRYTEFYTWRICFKQALEQVEIACWSFHYAAQQFRNQQQTDAVATVVQHALGLKKAFDRACRHLNFSNFKLEPGTEMRLKEIRNFFEGGGQELWPEKIKLEVPQPRRAGGCFESSLLFGLEQWAAKAEDGLHQQLL